jgi:hypothetical protein
MKTSLALLAVGMFTASVYALPDYEPFADATGSGGTAYTVGGALVGQTTAQGQSWSQAGPSSATTPTIASGDLTISGLYSAGGNGSAQFGLNGESARFNMSSVPGSGTVYYSFALKLTDISTLNSSGVFWAGFNNSAGSQTTTPSTVDTRVITRSATGGFNIGLDKSSGSTGSFVWAAPVFTTADTIFVVGSYTFNTATTSDDVSQLWVNPSSADFAAAVAPTPTLSSTAGNDITLNQIASFVLFDRNANEPKSGLIDDVRIGTTWADVTPTPSSIPEPATAALLGLGLLAIVRRFLASRS